MAFGYGSFQNHSYHANVRFIRDFANQVIEFRAAKNILRGEELTINYNGDPDDETPIDEGFGVP